jgi:MFS family permease
VREKSEVDVGVGVGVDVDAGVSVDAGVDAGAGVGAVVVKNPWAALWSMLIGFFMLMIDSTIVSVANPSIQASLDTSLTATLWVTSAYLLAIAVPLLVAGRLGDYFGQKQVFLVGMAVFTLASLGCGLAPGIEWLIAARVVQGLGGALMTPQTQAMVVRMFPPERRGAPLGVWGSVSGVAMLVGPMLGGLLVDFFGWQAIFLVNVPIGVVGLVLVGVHVPSLPVSKPRSAPGGVEAGGAPEAGAQDGGGTSAGRASVAGNAASARPGGGVAHAPRSRASDFDWLGMVLSGAGMLLVVFGVQEGAGYGWGQIWGPVSVWGLIGVGLAFLAAFVLWQLHIAEPLVPMRLFKDRDFSLASAAISTMGFTVTAMGMPMLYFLQLARGFDPTVSAVFMMPSAIVSGVLAPWVGSRVVPRLGANRVAGAGLVVVSASLLGYLPFFTPEADIWWALVPSAICGIGNACVWSPLALSATQNFPPADVGAGTGLYNVIRQSGTVVGAAAMTSLMNARLLAHGIDPASESAHMGAAAALPEQVKDGFAEAMRQSLLLPSAVALLGALFAAFLTGRGGKKPVPERK